MMEMLDGEIDGKRYCFKYAFSIDVKFEDCLNRSSTIGTYRYTNSWRYVDKELKDEFETNGDPLFPTAQVKKVDGKENDWVIVYWVTKIVSSNNPMDRPTVEGDITVFLIRKEDGKLNIYKGTEKEGEEKKRVSTGKKENTPSRGYVVIVGLKEITPTAEQQSEYIDQHASYQYR